MIIHLKKHVLAIGLAVIILSTALVSVMLTKSRDSDKFLGGKLYCGLDISLEQAKPVVEMMDEDYSERYQRPSKQEALPNNYNLQYFLNNKEELNKLQNPEDAIFAYFGILKEASNMQGNTGGCGTVGNAKIPYPYAYELLTNAAKEENTLQQFEDSFKGIGHITLLKVYPAYMPPDTPENTKYYMFEVETIKGYKNKKNTKETVNFSYYYGIITVVKEGEGWKIGKISYIPEDFLCAPYHSWFYDSKAVVEIVYKENLKIIDEVTKTENEGNFIYIYATGNGKSYKFDFIRLTNGYDILLHENIEENGEFVETDLLTGGFENFKLSILTVDKV